MSSNYKTDKNKKANRSLVTFRKNSREGNNSIVFLQNEEVNFSMNLQNNKDFLNKKKIKNNLHSLKGLIFKSPNFKSEKTLIQLKDNKINLDKDQTIIKSEHNEILIYDSRQTIKNEKFKSKEEQSDDFKVEIKSKEVDEEDKFFKNEEASIKKDKNTLENNIYLENDKNSFKEKFTTIRESHKSFEGNINNKTNLQKNEDCDHSSKINFQDYHYIMCLICDNYFTKNNSFSLECGHKFCLKCSKNFYEEKIEEGDKHMKCPVYKCNYLVSDYILGKLVTSKHMNNYEKKLGREINYKQTQSGTIISSSNRIIHANDISMMPKQSSDAKVKLYSQRHVLNISNNESFLFYSKTKEQFCVRCYEPALFGKSGRKLVKCLNCWFNSCKFCGKEYTENHFNMSGFNYCKVFFRKKTQFLPISKVNFFREILIKILLFIIGYFLFIIGTLKHISNFYCSVLGLPYDENKLINSNKGSKNKYFLIILYYGLMILSIPIVLPLLIFIFPYFPIIVYFWN